MKKRILSTLLLLCAVWAMPMPAIAYTETTIHEQGSSISAIVRYSDDFICHEKESIDLYLQHAKDEGHILAFHYFETDVLALTTNDLLEYAAWLAENLYMNRHNESFTSGNKTEYSFIATDEFNKPIYCTMRFKQFKNQILYSIISTSYLSSDDAMLRGNRFENLIYWKIQ